MNEKTGEEKEKDTKYPSLVALRPTEDTSKKIDILRKFYNTRSEAIKKAIDVSYNGLLMKGTIERIVPIIKKIFGENCKVSRSGFGGDYSEDREERFLDFSYNSCIIIFDLPMYKIEVTNKNIIPLLNFLAIELKVEGLDIIKADIKKPIIISKMKDIDSEFLKLLHGLAAKNKINIHSITSRKKEEVEVGLYLDRYITPEERWPSKFTKDLVGIKNVMDEIKGHRIFKESNIKKE